jgi:hypothetical protein
VRPRTWPDGKSFAFTIFDDPDAQTFEASRAVYGLLDDMGFRTTKGVWPNCADPALASDCGETCANPAYVEWLRDLQQRGFEIGFHNATSHTSAREQTRQGLDRFEQLFGHAPHTMANHYHARESIYWGPARLTGLNRVFYQALTLGRRRDESAGHIPGHPYFWGDLCKERVRYVRNFVFPEINTLAVCPQMPYHDPLRPYVNFWFASSEGANSRSFLDRISEASQDRLEEQGGACIMYVHFGHGFFEHGALNSRFADLMSRLSRKNGWFVPVGQLLDHLRGGNTPAIARRDRARLERRWLRHKMRTGTS